MKTVVALGLGVALAGVVFADSFFRDSTTYTVAGKTNIVNIGSTPICVSSLEFTYESLTNGTISISRIRSGVTNLLVAQVYTNATSVFFNRGELDGVWFKQNDGILLDTGLDSSTNKVILGTEEAR